jgi:IS30 family transposase
MAKGYHHLTYGQRCHIAALRGSGVSITEIARQLDVHKSSISRELRRNNTHRIYQPDNAHQTSVQRRKNASEAFKKSGLLNQRPRVNIPSFFLQIIPPKRK